ncbi:hypothetical protein [Spiroplasma alleghenense]|uniref:Uncharacterized protein n=1 Tax=Spiroplasma alleghenense TaxID=216931 RepID=A0A345Z3E0_9MOLU|nr:hypothetical protein [Spiroplasma alleghenense]AXK51119.1 hypothetical protein SALLE_v1c04450 [Spiroplasma alleghenense]
MSNSSKNQNAGYQNFLAEKKQRDQKLLDQQKNIRAKPQIKAVPPRDAKFEQLILKAKTKNQNNQIKVEEKLNLEYLKISVLKTKTVKGKKSKPNDTEVLRDKIANRVSKKHVFGNIISNYRKK